MTTDPTPSQSDDPATAGFLPLEIVATISLYYEWLTRFTFDLDEDGLHITWSCSEPDGEITSECHLDSDPDSAWRDALSYAASLSELESIDLQGLERLDINGSKGWRTEAIALALMRDGDTSIGEDLLTLTELQFEQIYREADSLFGTDRTHGLGATIVRWQELRRKEEIDDISFGAMLTRYGYGDRFDALSELIEFARRTYRDRSSDESRARIN